MDVALDGADDHLAQLRRAGFGQKRPQDRHARLHRIGRQQDFRHEQDAVAEVDADDAHAFDQCLGQDVVGRPTTLEQDVGSVLDLLLEAVIKVVMHLLHKFLVGKVLENDFIVCHSRVPRFLARPG
ncbi:hypothetical protein D3C87_1645260 [compost metagenome]